MEIEKLDNALEALLFVSGDGLKLEDLMDSLELQKSELNAAIKRLKEKYSDKCGIRLISYNGKIQFASNPEYAEIVSAVLQTLLDHNLIEVVGRKDVIGKPLLYATTDEFLKRFQIESIKDLPDYEQLLESIQVISDTEKEQKGLYNEFELPEEEEAPEFLQGEKIERIE